MPTPADDRDTPDGEVTRLLRALRAGDASAPDRLFPLVYRELRAAADRALRRERPDHTLQPTELVHDAYQRLAGAAAPDWQGRAHFLGVAARAMRQILVDHARHRNAEKRGGGLAPATLDDRVAADLTLAPEELIALDDALHRLDAVDPRMRAVVEARFFAGMTEEETAHSLGVTVRTVQRDWARARAWLHRELADGGTAGDGSG